MPNTRFFLSLLLLSLSTALFTADLSLSDKVAEQARSLPFVTEIAEDGAAKTMAGEFALRKADALGRNKDVEVIKSAIGDYKRALKRSSLSKLAQDSVVHIIDRLLKKDAMRATDEVGPAFARRLVQHDWLKQFEGGKALEKPAERLSRAVAKAMELEVTHQWRRGTQSLELWADAWSPVAWVLTDRKQKHVAMRPAVPMYDSSLPINKSWVQVSVDKKADLTQAGALKQAQSLAVYSDGKELATWTAKTGFNAEQVAWREVFKSRGQARIDNYFPPHIVHRELDGTLYSIVSKHGVLESPKSPKPSDSEAFLAQAAKTMPDGAHLDLIGQYFFKYVYDSPETSVPFLIGNRDLNGDIHQTALETLSTVAGGVCRGDCDDLSELYHNIIHRQGKLGHVVLLPGHAALAFAEQKNDQWSVCVLQTGPAYEFKDAELPKALGKAYKQFGATETFDPNGLGLLLRFSNEKTRGPWRLGWRIFSDKEYAETMIDIQKDWHYQTYLQAIKKMQVLLKDDKNKDPANYRELSSLYGFTAQYDKFVEFHDKALELTKDPVSKLTFHQDYINTMFGAGRHEDATKMVDHVLQEVRKPELAKALGSGIISYGLNIASTCASHHESQRALTFLDSTVTMAAAQIGGILNQFIQAGRHKTPAWNADGQISLLRRTVRQYIDTGLTALKYMPEADRPANAASSKIADEWLKKIAFADVQGPSGILNNYAVLATKKETTLGRDTFMEKIIAASFPESPKKAKHKELLGGDDEAGQLPWIKASAPLWAQRILSHINDKSVELDKTYLKQCDQLLQESLDFVKKHKLDSRSLQISSIQAQVGAAMIAEDYARMGELLALVKKRDDKWLRDGVAALMGNASRHVSIDAFNKALDVWVKEVNYKPKYYWIAWRAAIAGSKEAALAAAKRAAELFKDDQSFVEEYNYMKQLFK